MLKKRKTAQRILAATLVLSLLGGMLPWTVSGANANTSVAVVQPTEMYPEGITVNLYDYWLSNPDDSDQTNPSDYTNKGINQGHILNFGRGMTGGINGWTGTARPNVGIVQNVLDSNGFPKLAYKTATTPLDADAFNQGQFLDYLFNGASDVAGKQAYTNVGGLLQQDAQGYYYYNCRENFAVFDKNSKIFKLYSEAAVKDTKNVVGQFFPFNSAEQVFSGTELSCDSATINHYFGVNMVTRFQQPEDGISPESTNNTPVPVTYSFTGDDDVWVFIDDVLVADLGGIHDATSVEIDFHTGNVYIFEDRNNNGAYDANEPRYNDANATLKTAFEAAGKGGDASDWNGSTFANNTYHTMKFFYLERGNSASNMNMKFNLDTVLESQIEKTDQDGQPVANAEFALYEANADYDKVGENPIATGTTDDNGMFTFYDNEDMVLLLSDLTKEHYILQETKVPEGYRNSGPIHLKVEKLKDGSKLLLSDNAWDTGAYAMPTVRVEIQRAQNETSSHQVTGYDETTYNVDKGLVFAAVMEGSHVSYDAADISDNHIVYGDPVRGWHISEAKGTAAIEEAAQAMSQATQENAVAGLYDFKLNGINQYYTDIENLPGDINEYAVENTDNARFTVGYFYAPVTSLDQVTADNVVPLKASSFYHEFAMRLFAPNIQNRLLVQKVDADTQAPRDGAKFALYKAEDVTVKPDGTYTIDAGAVPAYNEQTTGEYEIQQGNVVPGTLAFTGVALGSYYLVETQPPDGYEINPTAVEIVVDHAGVHANAGTPDDDIAVHLGLGKIVKSMLQFALDDGIDATLSNVTAALKTSSTAAYSDIDWAQANSGGTLDFSYNEATGVLEYGPASGSGPITLDYDTGWGLLNITQSANQAALTANGSQVKQLGDQLLNNLFSGTTMVVVGDALKDAGTLTITKKVEQGLAGDGDRAFNVQLTLGANGLHNGQVFNKDTGEPVAFQNNVATLSIKDGESIHLSVPHDVTLTVAEVDADGFDVRYQLGGAAATTTAPQVTISSNDSQTVTILNTRQEGSYVTLDGAAHLAVTKQLDVSQVANGTWPDDASFQFKIEGQNGAPMPEKDTITISKNNDGSNTNSGAFDDIVFEQAGTYTYLIHEVAGDRSDMVYDDHQLTVTVTVEAATDDSLRVTNVSASGSDGSSGDTARTFVNVLQDSGSGEPGTDPDHPLDPDGPDDLDTVNHFSYIVGYPEDYRTGEKSDDESLWPVNPQGDITRGEVASMFYRLLKKDVREANTTDVNAFSDVNSDDWYNVPVSSLAEMRLIAGYQDGTFRPNEPITRAEFAAIATRFFEGDIEYTDQLFSDISGDEWYADVIAKAACYQLIGGYPDGSVQPNSTITRAESCAIVNRTLNRRPDADHLQPVEDMRTWPDNPADAWYYADMQEATNGHDYEWIDNNGQQDEVWTEVLPGYDWSQR